MHVVTTLLLLIISLCAGLPSRRSECIIYSLITGFHKGDSGHSFSRAYTISPVAISSCSTGLTQHISHHDTLNYDRNAVQQQHERMRRSNSDAALNRWKPLRIRFTALDR